MRKLFFVVFVSAILVLLIGSLNAQGEYSPVLINPIDGDSILITDDISWIKSDNPYRDWCMYKIVFRKGETLLDSFIVVGEADTMVLFNPKFVYLLETGDQYSLKIFTSAGAPFGWCPELDGSWIVFNVSA